MTYDVEPGFELRTVSFLSHCTGVASALRVSNPSVLEPKKWLRSHCVGVGNTLPMSHAKFTQNGSTLGETLPAEPVLATALVSGERHKPKGLMLSSSFKNNLT